MTEICFENPQLLKNYYEGVEWLENRHFLRVSGTFCKEYNTCNEARLCVSFTYFNNTHCIEKARGKWSAIVHYQVRNKTGEIRTNKKKEIQYTPEYHKVAFCETPKEALKMAIMINKEVFDETMKIVNDVVNS